MTGERNSRTFWQEFWTLNELQWEVMSPEILECGFDHYICLLGLGMVLLFKD